VKLCVGKAVQPAALALCVQHVSGNKRRAAALCKHAVQFALSDRNKSNVVTLSHMEQAIRFFVFK
jgi:Cdc6-like AAA superfamily ATPase